MSVILRDDWTFVTRNAVDFRGRPSAGSRGFYAGVSLHAGLICLIGEPVDLRAQNDMLVVALDVLACRAPINERIEVALDGDTIHLERFAMP